jgi:hypothetical protein
MDFSDIIFAWSSTMAGTAYAAIFSFGCGGWDWFVYRVRTSIYIYEYRTIN